ncbi:nitroreductase family protein [Romboutsia ilealis]|uniref:nitroreductase family protein n=1 Tax=Romboutsia ilealis TaxID=1115758 RepID=UPI0025747B13|nr:nitroreductase family protein [Romboutsia ilealis]
MKPKKEWIKACDKRVSRRTYNNKNIENSKITSITELINKINSENSLNIQFVKDGKNGLSGFKASYGMINDAKSFVALVADKNIENYKVKLGYFGEMIVLEAVSLGLSTCWIGVTYNKKECENLININDNEDLVCVIALGYSDENLSIKEKLVKRLNQKEKTINEMLVSRDEDTPNWVLNGIKYALNAPSAVNKKPIIYECVNGKIEAIISKPNHGYEEVDLGISMLHFQLGSMDVKKDGYWKHDNGHYIFE